MGWGDEIIVTGQAREMQERKPNAKVVVYDQHGYIRKHDIWANNPRIATRNERLGVTQDLKNCPGYRPYIAGKTETHWKWRPFRPPVGEIYFSPEELSFVDARATKAPAVIIEPNIKQGASPNKDWGRSRWQRLANLLNAEGIKPTQLGSACTQLLNGVHFIETPSFRHGCAVLARARSAILPEGGMHHAAAALKVPAVVIYGGYISPNQTGYPGQVALVSEGEPCGARQACRHCIDAMAAITPEMVLAAYRSLGV